MATEKQWSCGCREVDGTLVAKCSESKDEAVTIEKVKSQTCYRDMQQGK